MENREQIKLLDQLCDWLSGKEPSGEPVPHDIHREQVGASSRMIEGFGTVPCVSRQEIQVIQTHISWIVLFGEWALKLKKSVRTDFLDYGSVDKRFEACCAEFQLNRRTAPEIYLGVITLAPVESLSGSSASGDRELDSEAAGRLDDREQRSDISWRIQRVEIDTGPLMPDGTFETGVLMRRFPEDALLGIRMQQGSVDLEEMDQLASRIAAFHRGAEVANDSVGWGEPQLVHQDQVDNLNHLRNWVTGDSDRDLLYLLDQWVAGEAGRLIDIFGDRKRSGFVRSCHGDLHLDNIVRWGDHWIPFDGIEFNDRLSWIDTQSDLAFTVMDLFAHGADRFAHRLLNAYLERSGDYSGLIVQRWYQVYRALVRAKVAAMRADQEEVGSDLRDKQVAAVSRGLRLASRLVGHGQQGLTITHGLSGSGKSFYSQRWVDRFGAIRVRSDIERKRLFARSLDGPGILAEDASVEDLYGSTATEATYLRLENLVRQGIQAGYEMIVDATFLRRRDRDRFRILAERCQVPFGILALEVDEATLVRRLVERQQRGDDVSDADVAVLRKQYEGMEPLDEDERALVVEI